MKTAVLLAMFAGALLLCAARLSRADTVTATLIGVNPMSGLNLNFNGSSVPGALVGELDWNGAGQGNLDPGFQGVFTTFCLDLNDEVAFTTFTFFVEPSLPLAPSAGAGGPMGAYKAAVFYSLYGNYFAGLANSTDTQAFALAVWSILYNDDGITSVTDSSQDFYVTGSGASITEADSFLTTAWGAVNPSTFAVTGPSNPNVAALIGIDPNTLDHNGQDQIIPSPTAGGGTPLPATARSGGAIIAGLGLYRIIRAFSRRGRML